MKIDHNRKVILCTSVISSLVFFIVGSIFFKSLLNYGDWTGTFILVHVVMTFIVMIPLLIPFWFIERSQLSKKHPSIASMVGTRTAIGLLYISILLGFLFYSESDQRIKDPFNYFEDLKYLGLSSLISVFTFAIIDFYFYKKKATNLKND